MSYPTSTLSQILYLEILSRYKTKEGKKKKRREGWERKRKNRWKGGRNERKERIEKKNKRV